jgi:GNAT superfamily N-acetyltransferase
MHCDSSSRPSGADGSWHEEITLKNGTTVRLRPILPSDKERLRAGLLALSPESQYLRFFTAKPRLTDAELAYFTELDGWDHFAIGATTIAPDGSDGDGVGVARFVRLPGERDVAEPAIVVIDALQGQGLGTVLMERLIEAAREREIRSFRSEFLAVNDPIRALLEKLSPQVTFTQDGPIVTAEFPLLPAPAQPHGQTPAELMQDWLRMAAEQTLELRRRFAMIFDPDRLLEAWRRLRGRKEEEA